MAWNSRRPFLFVWYACLCLSNSTLPRHSCSQWLGTQFNHTYIVFSSIFSSLATWNHEMILSSVIRNSQATPQSHSGSVQLTAPWTAIGFPAPCSFGSGCFCFTVQSNKNTFMTTVIKRLTPWQKTTLFQMCKITWFHDKFPMWNHVQIFFYNSHSPVKVQEGN